MHFARSPTPDAPPLAVTTTWRHIRLHIQCISPYLIPTVIRYETLLRAAVLQCCGMGTHRIFSRSCASRAVHRGRVPLRLQGSGRSSPRGPPLVALYAQSPGVDAGTYCGLQESFDGRHVRSGMGWAAPGGKQAIGGLGAARGRELYAISDGGKDNQTGENVPKQDQAAAAKLISMLPGPLRRRVVRAMGCKCCAGSRQVRCPNCDGVGRYIAIGGRSVGCNGCRGTGRVVCRSCFIGDGWDIDAIRRDMGYPD